MSKKLSIIAAISLLLIVCLSACVDNTVSPELKMPQDKLAVKLDDSIPLLSGDKADVLSGNIDRGYRLETYYTLGTGEGCPGTGIEGKKYLDDMLEFYADEKVNEIQVYIYLNNYKDKDLDALALGQMKEYFEYIRGKKMSMVLRYAYEPIQLADYAPTHKQMIANIAILKDWIRANIDLWYSTVTVYQIGMVGAWGEFGASNEKYDRKEIVNKVCDMVPEKTYIQGRYVDVTKTAKAAYQERIGYHNDFIVGRPHPWGTPGANNDSKNYKIFEKSNKYRLNDGETPWAGGTEEPNDYIDGRNFARQLYEHHMTTFSIEHNYKEYIRINDDNDGKVYNIARFKEETITAADAAAMGVPYYDAYFKDAAGQAVSRSIFDYVRDFLGYHLVMTDLKVSNSPSSAEVGFTLVNFGFGAPLNVTDAQLVLIDRDGNEEIYPVSELDVKNLTTYAHQTINVKVPHSLEGYTYGIRFNRAGGYTIRTANDIPYVNGVNILA